MNATRLLCVVCLIAPACSSDSPNPSDARGEQVSREGGAGDGGAKDSLKDTIAEGPARCTPFAAKTNSGKVCTSQSQCGAEEACLPLKQGAPFGMCLGKCCQNVKDDQDPVNSCPVANSNQLSVCVLAVQGVSGPASYMGCAFVCSVTQAGKTLTYDCPDTTSFSCEVYDPKQPDLKFCMPK